MVGAQLLSAQRLAENFTEGFTEELSQGLVVAIRRIEQID
ncbi:MAG: hypothetical protein BMS9Abin05_0590 [Rhodothermia bacterium]|nr:MAG: hypothetical protein BMS9Abin05_0590 [Rhodothermia bacterium]